MRSMSFFANLRSDRLIAQIKASSDPLGEAALKAGGVHNTMNQFA